MSSTPRPTSTGISTGFTVLLAVACGASAANLYYAQPLLSTIAKDFGTGSGQAGLIVTLAQVGYALGLAFLVPAGDLVARRRLVPIALVLTAVGLALSAAAPSLGLLTAISLLVGLGSVAAQILVPLAASLADDEDRGRVVGTVMSGLLLGILLARTAAGLVLIVAAVLAKALPDEAPRPRLSYGTVLTSTVKLFGAEAVLRRRAALGAMGFAAFSIFWTTMAFLLSGAPYHYSDTVIGLFGLVGAAGALCANAAGKLADRERTGVATLAFGAAILASFVPIYLGRHSLFALIVGIVVLDVGVQGLQVTNQSLIYRLAPEARSRVTSSYMVCYFAGGAAGSAISGSVYDAAGWAGVCLLGGGVGLVALLVGAFDAVRPARVRAVDPALAG